MARAWLACLRDPKSQLTRDAIYQHFPGYLGAGQNTWRTTPVSLIQQGPWKLMEFLEDGRRELYQLDQDVSEAKNLIEVNPDKAEELHRKLLAWRSDVKAPMPTPNREGAKPAKKKAGKKK